MNSDRFYFRRFFKKPAAPKAPARKRLMETMEDRILYDAAPVVTIDAPAEIGVGQSAEVTVSFSNGSADVGYGPWVDVFIDATGADGAANPLAPSNPQTGNLDGVPDPLDPFDTRVPGDQFDGFTLTGNPTYLTPSNGLNFTLLTLDSEANGGLGVLHPYATDQLGNRIYVDINGSGQIVYHNAATSSDTVIAGTNYQTGDKLLVIELPFGSYTQAQPPADITFELSLSEFADVGQPLSVTAVGGFRFGNTPGNDPATDPSIIGAGTASVSNVGVTLATLSKTYGGPENETATGASYLRTYRINVDIATGQTLEDLHLFDDLDPTIQFAGISGSSHAYTVIGSLPSTTVPGGKLAVSFDDPITGGSGGSDAWIEIQFYIPRVYDSNVSGTIDGADAPVLQPDSGADFAISNQAYGFGNWIPADPRDLGSAAIVGFNVDSAFDSSNITQALLTAAPDGPAEHLNLEASPLVVQKDYTVITNVGVSGNSPGDVLEFTLNFQISDYFAFDDLVISDLISDGLRFDSSFVPTLEINGNTYVLGAGGWTLANYTVSQNFTGAAASGNQIVDPAANDGTTTLSFRISEELAARAASIVAGTAAEIADKVFATDGKLLGGGVNPDDPSAPIANSGYTGGATTGRIVYRAIIQDVFTDDFPSGEPSVNARDVLTNTATITGTVLDLTTGAALVPHAVPAVSTDDSSESLTIASERVTKTIYAVNGNTDLSVFQDANGRVNLQPGDIVTYRFQYTIPTGDIENLRFTDFLPLPIFDVDNINADGTAGGLAEWSFVNNTGDLTVISFTPGTITYGPDHTLHTVSNPANPVPVITINSGGNSVTMQWADFVNTLNDTKQVDILLSATVSSDPFADGLFLTNMVQSGEGNTQSPATESLANAIIQIVLNQPAVDIYKGVVASTQGGAAPATGGLTFSATGAGTGFTGTLDSVADAEAVGALDLGAATAVDAGDLVRFAIVAQNTGRSDAFDVTVTDTLTNSYVNTYTDTSAFVAGTNFAVYRGGDGANALNGGEVDAFVRAASTANYATLTGVSNTVDGITLANGDRILLKDQTTVSENGIYVVSAVNSTAGTMTLTLVMTAPAAVAVTGGAASGNKRFTEAADVWTLDATTYDYFVAYDTAAKTFTVQLTDAYITGNTAGDVNDGGLSRGYNPATSASITNGSNAVVILYDLTVASTAQASSTVTNTATLTNYAGADGTDDHTAEDEIESASVVIAAPTASKVLVGTTVSETGNGQYQAVIGETATYTITVNIPEGTTGQLAITDLLDSGLAFADLVSVTASAGVVTDFSTFGDGMQTSTSNSAAQVYITNNGQNIVFNLGNVVTNGTAGASAQTVTITYTAVVLNILANQSGTVLDNTAQAAWEWTNDSALPALETEGLIENLTDPANKITLVEPQISISNSLSLDNVTYTNNGTVQASAGQTVYYQVVVSNTGTVAAYDLSLYDRLPNVLREAGVTAVFSVILSDLDGSNAVNITAGGNFNIVDDTTYTVNPGFVPLPALTSTGTLLDLAAGKKVTIVVQSRVEEDAVAASTHPNGIQVRWTSLNDNVRSVDGTDTDIDPVNPVGGTNTPIVLSAYNANAVERTGAQGPAGALDNYAATDDLTATILEVQPVAIAKLLLGTQINNAVNSATQAVVGEYVDYSVSFSIPKGLTKDFTLTDTLSSGLAFVEFLSVTVGTNITTHVNGANAATAASLTAGDSDNLDLLDDSTTVATGGGSFVVDLGDIYNSATAGSPGDYVPPQQITITYRVLVTNVAANQTAQTRNNLAQVEYTTANDVTPQVITISDVADDNVTLIEPALSIATEVAKDSAGSPGAGTTPDTFGASTATPLDAGDYVYYRIRITNPAAGSTTAYDIQVIDAVPSFINPASLSVHSVALTTASGGAGGSLAGSVFDNATNLTTADFTFTGNTLGVTGTSNLDLGPDSTLEIVVRGTVASTVAPAETATNNATVRWTSIDGGTVAATSAYTTDDTERTGADASPAAGVNASTPATNTGGPLNNYAAASANTTVTASTVTLTKTIISTSEAHTTIVSGTERVAIGEIVRYRLVTTIPEGTSVGTVIRDNLPAGMLFVNDGTAVVALVADTATNISSSTFGTSASVAGDAATLSSITPTHALDDASVSKDTASDDDSWDSGNDPLFKLGTITNSENDADAEYVIIEFNVLVLNTAGPGNQAGTTLGNNYEVFLNNSTAGGDKRGATSSTVNAIIAEPTLTVTQNVSTTGPVDAGDTFTYTLTIANTATGDNAAAAFDVRIRDILDALTASNPGVEIELAVAPTGTAGGFVGGSVALTAPGYASVTANGSDTTQVDLTLSRLNAGDSITLVVTATVKSGALAGAEIENKAVVTYTSLPGSGTGLGGSTIATALAGSSLSGAPLTTLTANASERSGADSEATTTNNNAPADNNVRNNYAVAAVATSGLTVAAPALDLSWKDGTLTSDDTSVASTSGANAVIGETVTFDILVTLPEGVTDDLRVDVALPAGLRIDGYTVVTAAAGSNRLTADFNGTVDATPTVTLPATGPATVTFDFGDTTTVNDNVTGNNAFVLRVTATVVNILSNQAGVTRATTASLRYNDPDGSGNAGPAADRTVTDSTSGNNPVVTIVEPTLTVTKGSVLPAGNPLDAGDTINYTITLANSSGQTAYDVTLSDPINSQLVVTAGVIPGGALTISGGATVSANAFEIVDLGGGNFVLRTAAGANIDIPTGESVVITFSATVSNSIPPAATITNVANARWTSTDGANTDERGGSDVADTAPSTINQALTTGALNNYALSSGVVNNAVNDIAITKAVIDSSIGNDTVNAAPGELVTYRLTITLPEGTVPDLRIRDAIPAGMAYVPGSLVLNTTGFLGSVTAPAVSPTSGTTYTDGQDIEFDFSAITVTADNTTANNTFTFTYQAVVLDVASNVGLVTGQDTLTNTATHNNGSGSTFSSSAGSDSITVVEPQLAITKTRNTANADAGDAVTYTITISHTGQSTSAAYDLNLADTLPAGFTATGFTATIATANDSAGLFNLTGQAFTTTGTVDLALGQTLTVVITGAFNSTVTPNQTVNNAATLTYDSHPGNITDRGNTDLTTDRDRETTVSANVGITVPEATFTKTLFSTSQVFTTGSNVAIGETVTYALVVTLPEGTTPDLSILDRLPPGMQYVSSSIVTDAVSSGGLLSADFNGTLPAPSVTGGATSGADVGFTFGSISVAADATFDITVSNSFVILVTARVENVTGNQSGNTLAADATFDISGDGLAVFTTAAVNVAVVEPRVTVTQTVTTASTAGLDAGDTVTYQVTINNLAINGATADAFDVTLADVLPAGMLIGTIGAPTLTGGATVQTALSGATTNTLGGTFDIPLGGQVVFTFTAVVPNTVTPGQSLTADINVTYSSLDGNPADARDGADVTDPESNTPPTVNTPLNNYAVGADTTLTAIAPFAVTKALTATSLGADSSASVVIGEVLTYTVTVTVMEGTTGNIVLNDTLPAGLEFIAGSASVLDANGMTITGFNANTLDQTLSSVVNPGNTDAPGTADTDTFTYTYQVRVTDIPANVAGQTRINDLDASATGVTSDNNNQVTVTITEPSLTLDKVTTTTGSDAGDAVVYTLTITNATGATVGTAYDINVTDLLDTDIELINTTLGGGIVVTGATVDANTSTTGSLNLVLRSLAPGASVTITLNAVVKATAPAGATIANAASITYSTLPDGHPDEAFERSDYAGADTSASFTLATPTIDKQTPADTTYSIGEIVTYDILVTLPEGVTEDLVITDNLPAGLVYTGFEVVATGFTGTVTAAPTVANPSGNVRTFTFGDVTTTGNNAAGDNTFTLRVSARVANIAGNQGAGSPTTATTFSNTATLQYTNGTTLTTANITDASAPAAITVVEPVLQITKNAVTTTTNLDAGDTVTYEIVVSHTGASTADAFDLLLADTLPAQLTGFTLDSALIGATNVASSFTLTAGGVLSTTAGAIDLAQGQTLTLRISGVIRDTVVPGTDINNTASLTYTSINGVDVNERDGSGTTNDYTATANAPELTTVGTLAVTKTADVTTAAIGDIVTYTVTVTVAQGRTTVSLADTLPAGLVFVSGTAALTTPGGWTITGFNANTVNQTLTITNPGTTDNAAALESASFTYTYEVLVQNVVGNQAGNTRTNAIVATADLNNDGDTSDTGESDTDSDTVTLTEPSLSLDKVTTTAGSDAGDSVVYTLTITNSNAANTSTAYDINLIDLLDTDIELINTTLGSGIVVTGATVDANTSTTGSLNLVLQSLAPGASATITLNAVVKSTVVAGSTVTNTASITYTSTPGTNTDERGGTGGINDYTDSDTSSSFVLGTPTIDKQTPADTTYSIGEIVTYDILVTLPEGVTEDLVITDNLPAGLIYTGFEVVSTGFTGTVTAAPTVANPSGNIRTFTFGDVTTTGNNAGGDNTFTLRVSARVDNVVGSQGAGSPTTATTFSNTATLQYTNGTTLTTTTVTDPSAPGAITVVEPVLTFDKAAITATTGLDAGDTVQFTLTFENTGTATAHDVLITDLLPAGLLVTTINSTVLTGGATADTAVSGTTTLTGEYTIPVGGRVVITYTATLQNTVTPDTDYTNSAQVTWSSVNGLSADERTGSDGLQGTVGALNDYSLEDAVTVSTATTFLIAKTADKTTAAIGDKITYTLTLTLNEGTTRGVVLTDTLPVTSGVLQLGYVTGSAAIVHTTVGGSITGSVTPVVSGAQNQTLTFTLGDIVVPAGAAANTVTITYEAIVANVATNQAGDTEANSVTGTSTDIPPGTDLPGDNTHTVTLTEPSLTLDKVTTTTGSDAGDAVVYTLTITNSNAANTSTAYDINVTDFLDADIQLINTTLGSGIVVTGATVTANTSTTGSLNLVLQSLSPGASATITLNAVVKATAPAGTTIENTASITYTSTPGTNTDERGGTGGINDYTDSDTSSSFVLGTPTIDKQTPADTTYSIGEIVTYDILVTLPEGVTEDLVITDNLPAGLVYTGFEVVATGFAGTVTASPTVGNPSGNVRTFTFGDVTTTGNNAAGDNTFTLRVSARVANISGNQGAGSPAAATTFSNTAALQYTDGTNGTTTVNDASVPGAITVVEPVLQITKTVVTDDDALDAGDTVTYEITVSHTGASTADAFDLLLADTLPAQLTGFTLDSALIGATNVAGSFTLTAGGVLSTTAGAIDLAQGQTLTLRISGVIRDTVVPGTDLNNTASLTYTSINGVDVNERDGSGTTNDYTATANAPELTTVGTLAITKTADVTTAAIGDIVTYTVTVTVAQGTTTVSLADMLPAGLVFVSGTAALTTPGGWTITGFNANTVNQTLTITNPGTTDNAASLESASFTYTYEVLVQNVVGNQAGATRTNVIVATADLNNDGDTTDTGESDTDSDTVTLTEPSLSLTKVTNPPAVRDAGAEFTYVLTITNSNAANTSTAYDIRVRDLLDSDIALIDVTSGSGIVVTGAVIASNASTTGELDLVLSSLAPGDSATLTLTVRVKDTAPAGATVANTASITYTSTPGANPDERDGSGGIDDYADSDTSSSFTLATPVIDKLDSATTTVAIGGTFSYDIDITLSEGVTRDLVITDLLPDGLVLVGVSIDDSTFVGTLPSPVITGGVTSGQDIVLDFGDVTTGDDNDTTNNTFRVTVTVRAVNELASQAPATTFSNTATLGYLNGTTLVTTTVNDPTAPAAVALTEPVVTVDKTVTDDTTPHLGQTITYRIVLTNTGTSTAHDVVFNDLIPDGLTGVAITGEVLAGGATLNAPGSGAVLNGTGTGLGGAYDIPVGGTVTITYTAVVSTDPAIVGGTFNGADEDRNSSVTITYSSLDGNPAEARDGADGAAGLNNYTATDDAPITLVGPGLRLDKTDGLASVTAGQSWTYTLTITNVGTDTATGVTLTDTIPPQITVNAVRVGGVDSAFSVIAGQVVLSLPDVLHTVGNNTLAVEFDVTLDAVIDAAREDLTNTATVTHDDVEPTPVDNTDDDTNLIAATPGIGVVKTVSSVNGAPPVLNGDGQPVVAPGDTVIYTIVLTNTGTQNVVVDITDTFPRIVLDLANATIDDADTGVAASVNLATGVITWNNVALDVGETITITIEASAFDPQLEALDTFPNTVVVSDVTDEVPDEAATVVADLSAFPDLVVTKVNSTDRIGINDVFTYTITLTNAGDQNAENVTIVDTLPPFVEFISASGNFIYDPVARTVTWNSAGNPELTVVDGRNAETVTFTLTVTLPLNSIVFGDLTNTVRAFDDGANGPDLNPVDNEDTQTTDVLGFIYDRLRNFSRTDAEEDDNDYYLGLPIEVYRDAILPIAPIYSGAAEPGSTLEVALYNADGDVIGRQTVVVDTGGNWMASFPGTIMKDYPQSVVITQTPASSAPEGSSSGYNLRPYYATAINAGHFFRENLNVARVSEQTSERVTEDLQDALNNPIGFEINSTAYESLASPGQPSGR